MIADTQVRAAPRGAMKRFFGHVPFPRTSPLRMADCCAYIIPLFCLARCPKNPADGHQLRVQSFPHTTVMHHLRFWKTVTRARTAFGARRIGARLSFLRSPKNMPSRSPELRGGGVVRP
jgi:hypothetical protein